MLTLRPATPQDIPQILAFIRELAAYEREPEAAVATYDDILRDGWGPTPRFQCMLAAWEGEPAGFALYFYNYSTWRGHAGVYLEDLFVRPPFRGRGIGKALLADVAATAVAEGCPRLEWAVLKWNQLAIDFYDSIGAKPQNEWTTMRLSGDDLARLGSHSSRQQASKDA